MIDTFKAKFNVDFVYFYTYSYFCINIYWSYEDVDIELKMSMKLQECLKDLISCIYNRENWTGVDAKWFQSCTQSSQEYITMFEYTKSEVTSYILGGTDETTSALTNDVCRPKVLNFGSWFSFLPWVNGGAGGSTQHISEMENTLWLHFLQYVAN